VEKLTALRVEKLKADLVRREIPDGLLRGLYLVVQPSGIKSWAVRYRSPLHGKSRKFTIGKYPVFSLADAREAAAIALRNIAGGGDPGAEKIQKRQIARLTHASSDLVRDQFEGFMERYAKRNTRENSWREYQRVYNKEINPRWGALPISTIKKRDVIELLDSIVDRGAPVQANRVLAVVRKFFNWCVERDILAASPCMGVKAPTPEKARERVLSDNEIRRIWLALENEPYPFGPMFKLLLLTGQRVAEVAGISWSEINTAEAVWSLPAKRAKNGRAHTVPLSPSALELIQGLPRIGGSQGFLFTTTGISPVSGESRAKSRVQEATAAGLDSNEDEAEHWTLHDFRRTVASGLQRLGFPVEVVEALLNHKSGKVSGVAAVYARHDYAKEKRVALEDWARHIHAVTKPAVGKKVIPLTQRSRRRYHAA